MILIIETDIKGRDETRPDQTRQERHTIDVFQNTLELYRGLGRVDEKRGEEMR